MTPVLLRSLTLASTLAMLAGCGTVPPYGPQTSGSFATSMAAARKAGLVERQTVLVQLKNLQDADGLAHEHGLVIGRTVADIRLVEMRSASRQTAADWLDT
ncbi:MAG TPA: hypothetical protein V6D05_02580, partial [Stenomitos sp.]